MSEGETYSRGTVEIQAPCLFLSLGHKQSNIQNIARQAGLTRTLLTTLQWPDTEATLGYGKMPNTRV
jgi:hypothetical protein